MTPDVTAYEYSIPLEDDSGVETPAYDIPAGDHVVSVAYGPNSVNVVTTESIPHFHRDSVTVTVDEGDLANYVDDVSEYTEELDEDEEDSDTEDGGGE